MLVGTRRVMNYDLDVSPIIKIKLKGIFEIFISFRSQTQIYKYYIKFFFFNLLYLITHFDLQITITL